MEHPWWVVGLVVAFFLGVLLWRHLLSGRWRKWRELRRSHGSTRK